MAAYEDDRKIRMRFDEVVMKIQSVSSGQPNVENEAPAAWRSRAVQEFLRRGEQFGTQTDRSQKSLERVTDTGIVVDDDDDGLRPFM
jgi:hypothetical protein